MIMKKRRMDPSEANRRALREIRLANFDPVLRAASGNPMSASERRVAGLRRTNLKRSFDAEDRRAANPGAFTPGVAGLGPP
eukprot:jgi/Tetstr1/462637/TSEL_007621.t1